MTHSYKTANIKLVCSTKFSYERSYDLALNILTFEELCGKINFSNTIITQSFIMRHLGLAYKKYRPTKH